MTASIFCSVIRRRAFSSLARRSSAVMGLARLRIELSPAMLGGSGPAGASAPRPRWADSEAVESPAAPVSQRNDRRDTMGAPSETNAQAAAHVRAACIDGQRIIERDREVREQFAEAEARRGSWLVRRHAP